MNGQMTKYKQQIEAMQAPIDPFDDDECVDIHALIEYAREKGVRPSELSASEKARFVKKRLRSGVA